MIIKTSVPIFSALLFLTGCSDSVLFVTTTQIGVDLDQKTQSMSIGYDRYEGFIGPVYDTGGVPPVIASIDSDLGIVENKVKQIYATGDAARIAAGGAAQDDGKDKKKLIGERRVMFFGTGTTFGFRTTASTQGLGSFNLGIKRQEFSYIPIGEKSGSKNSTDAKKEDVYASVLATLDLDTSRDTTQPLAGKEKVAGFKQFFATGDAAEKLAEKFQPALQQKADDAIKMLNTPPAVEQEQLAPPS